MKKFKFIYIPEWTSTWTSTIIEANTLDEAKDIFINDFDCANDINPEIEAII